MKSEKSSPSELSWAAAFLLSAWLGVCLALLLTGCTVTPKVVHDAQASFDGTQQNSGILGFDGEGHCVITLHAVERYNALVDKYGKRFTPPLQRNQGLFLTDTNTAVMSFGSVEYFATMNRWAHQEAPAWSK